MIGIARRSRLLLALLPLLGGAARLLAWGAGHDPVNRMALERLPAPIKAILSPDDCKAFVKQSHAPDDFTPWTEYEAKKARAIDLSDLRTPYAFHSAKGQAVNFILLYRALKDRDGSRTAFWGACLAHTFADEAACNHDPLIHYLTYAFTSGYGMRFGKGGMLDFGQLCRTPSGRALAREALGEQPPRRLGHDPSFFYTSPAAVSAAGAASGPNRVQHRAKSCVRCRPIQIVWGPGSAPRFRST